MKQIYFYMNMSMMLMFLVIIMILLSVAFLTLMERKFLGYIQIRKGPNKVGLGGILQPFSDAVKLMAKENVFMGKVNNLFFILSPIYMLMLNLMMWLIYPFLINHLSFNLMFLYLMCCFSMGVYGLLMSGWSSNSSFSMLGAVRSLAQSISYEVVLSLIMIIPLVMIDSLNLLNLLIMQEIMFIIFLWPLGLMFFFSVMAELNRTPFDFSEGESELVSGFNVEYSSSGFVLIFLSEYSSILFLSMLFNVFFLGGLSYSLFFFFKVMLLSFLVIWVRGTLPRFRYDLLMYLCWVVILPIVLNYLFFMVFIKMYI